MSTQSQEIEPQIKKPVGFQKGNKLGGRPAAGMQSIKDRLAFWFETKTVKEIEDLIENEKKWNKLPAIDAALCQVVSASMKSTGQSALTIILDRLLGKPAQAITGEDGKPLIPQTDMLEIARRSAFLLSLAAQQAITIDQPAIAAPVSAPARASDE